MALASLVHVAGLGHLEQQLPGISSRSTRRPQYRTISVVFPWFTYSEVFRGE
jgi:hypothetical protein